MVYPKNFRIQVFNQVIEKELPVADLTARLAMSTQSLYAWIKCDSKPQEEQQQDDNQQAELCSMRAELKRVSGERDI